MPENYNPEAVARLKHVNALAQLTVGKLTETIKYVSTSGNTVSFFTTADGSGTAAFTFDFPEELFLDQAGTTLVENFAWSAVTYPNSTNPNLDGKTVLVLGVRGNAATPTVKYSFVNLEKLIDTYTAADNSININGYTVAVKISTSANNAITLENDGLHVDISGKADKAANPTAGNIATLDANGNPTDSGVTFATDAEVINMLNGTFGAGSINSIS